MTERIIRSHDKTNSKEDQLSNHPKWIKAAGTTALAGAVAFGIFKAHESPAEPEKPQSSYSVEGSVPIVIQDGEGLIDATYRTFDKDLVNENAVTPPKPADILKTPLTDTQRSEITVSAKFATEQFSESGARLHPQPGDLYIADVGEFDGDEETDVRVRQATKDDWSQIDFTSNPENTSDTTTYIESAHLKSEEQYLPDYYKNK